MRSSITSANCASMARSRARRDRDGIAVPSMMALRRREAAGCRVSASSCCGGNDSILRGYNQSWTTLGLGIIVRTYEARAHCAAHGAVKEIAGEVHQLLWVGYHRFSHFFGGVFQDVHLVSCDSRLDGKVAFALLATAYSCWRRQMD